MPAKGSKKLSFNQNLAKAVPLTFLVAEDNVINRQILVNYLKKLGYEMENIIQAYDGVEAVHQYKASLLRPPNKRVNAVLMDLWMPNMDGYEATEKILKIARDKGESLAVMAVTADITSDSLERAFSERANRIIKYIVGSPSAWSSEKEYLPAELCNGRFARRWQMSIEL
jgi:CheY-like chemotaxis protein